MKRTSTTASTSPTTAPPSTSASTAAPSSDEAALAAYVAFWDMYIEVGGTPPPFDAAVVLPRLAELTTGAETEQLVEFFQNNAAAGIVLRGEVEHSPAVVSNDGTVAVVRDCMDDRTGVYRVADDSRIDTDTPERHLLTVSLRQADGRWRVETLSTEPETCTV